MLLGCIGDDFTGSSDLANTLAKQGMHTVQYSGLRASPGLVLALKSGNFGADDYFIRAEQVLAGSGN